MDDPPLCFQTVARYFRDSSIQKLTLVDLISEQDPNKGLKVYKSILEIDSLSQIQIQQTNEKIDNILKNQPNYSEYLLHKIKIKDYEGLKNKAEKY